MVRVYPVRHLTWSELAGSRRAAIPTFELWMTLNDFTILYAWGTRFATLTRTAPGWSGPQRLNTLSVVPWLHPKGTQWYKKVNTNTYKWQLAMQTDCLYVLEPTRVGSRTEASPDSFLEGMLTLSLRQGSTNEELLGKSHGAPLVVGSCWGQQVRKRKTGWCRFASHS